MGAVAFLSPVALHAGQLAQGDDSGVSVWRVVLVFLLCTALAVVAIVALKFRLTGTLPALRARLPVRRLQIRESLRTSHQTDLCIIACDGKEILVAISASGTRVLCADLPIADAACRESGGD
jgi:hypothetical protein